MEENPNNPSTPSLSSSLRRLRCLSSSSSSSQNLFLESDLRSRCAQSSSRLYSRVRGKLMDTMGFVADFAGKQVHKGCVNAVNFSHDGEFVVTGSDDTTVKIWKTETRECVRTLHGHASNVFATNFLPHKSNRAVLSASNDSDIRHYDIEAGVCTVYQHHWKKVLKLSVNPQMPDIFLSCSADGAVRLFDTRQRYNGSISERIRSNNGTAEPANEELNNPLDSAHSNTASSDDFVIPQAFGGGRASALRSRSINNYSQTVQSPSPQPLRSSSALPTSNSLLIDYTLKATDPVVLGGSPIVLYSVDFHPFDGRTFVVGSMDGNVRLFDLRKIENRMPTSYVNIFGSYSLHETARDFGSAECTGVAWSRKGDEIVASLLGDSIYLFDVNRNFKREFQLDYSPWRTRQKRRLRFLRRRQKELIERTASNIATLKELMATQMSTARIYLSNQASSSPCPNASENDGNENQENGTKDSVPEDEDDFLARPRPPAEMLLELVQRYPQYRNHLLDSAIDPEEMALCLDGILSVEMLLDIEGDENGGGDDQLDEQENESDDDDENHSASSSSSSSSNRANVNEANTSRENNNNNNAEEDVGDEEDDDDVFGLMNFDYDSDPDTDTMAPRKHRGLETYKRKFDGHVNFITVKGVSFFGPDSEYIVSGSDDSRVFIWEKSSGRVVQILEGHADIVNCVVEHPALPLIVTSGMESEAKLWAPLGGELSEKAARSRQKKLESILVANEEQKRRVLANDDDI